MKKFICYMLFLLMGINCVSAENFDVNKFVDEYGQEVQSIIKSNLNYKGTENAASAVSYTIQPDGSVTDIKLEQKSGTEFDRIPTIYSYIPQEPVIKCTILKDGTIKNVEVTKSSEIEEYDKKIIETYTGMKVSPFPEELKMYKELPYSATVLRQFRRTPALGNPNYMFR